MAYQTTCAVLNITSAWNVRPHFSMTRRDARCPAAVTLMILASGVRPAELDRRTRALGP
jgi:hypothetical protein